MRRKVAILAALFFIMAGVLAVGWENVAYAGAEQVGDSFSGNVELIRQENDRYVMQVTVENNGVDFTGTVQVIFASTHKNNCAYNTEITLPAQGKKTFMITVTERAVNTVRGVCTMNFLDEDGKLIQSILKKNVFGSAVSGVLVGILSDNTSSLNYLDAGGGDFTVRDVRYPLQLIELDGDQLEMYLDRLYFLVIDQYDVSALGEEKVRAIQEWVRRGGWLLIGTGAYAEQTLSGFEPDFLKVDILNISEPGEENEVVKNAEKYSYYSYYGGIGIDLAKVTVAELNCDSSDGNLYEMKDHPAVCGGIGDGAVMIYFCSLGEKELQKLDDYKVQDLYQGIMYSSNNYQVSDSDMEYVGMRSFTLIDNRNTKLDFTVLEWMIVGYVILIGPVLYLILRRCKKSEWYWVGVPILGFVFIGVVFVFGQSAKVSGTKVYSVTAQQADGNRKDTYFLAYHSGVKEWDMLLDESYDVAGPGWDRYYFRNSYATAEDYYFVVNSGVDGLSVGLKPRENFENGLLYAGGRAERKGVIRGENVELDRNGNVRGTVTNDTVCDMAYMAVGFPSYLMVFSEVKAGETLDLQEAERSGRCVYTSYSFSCDDLLYDMVFGGGNIFYSQDDIAALLIGMGIAGIEKPEEGNSVVIGLVKDYDRTVKGKCDEISYGCLYAYMKTEGEENAPD